MAKTTAASQGQQTLVGAFLELRESLRHFVGRIVQRQDIEDIVEETFLRSYEAAGKQRIQHPRAYMWTTAKHIALNHVTKPDYRLTDTVDDMSFLDTVSQTASLESQLEAEERFLSFCRGVRELPLQCRRTFILKKVYGLTQKEISEYLGISQSTVEKHVKKGLSLCVDYMRSLEHQAEPTLGTAAPLKRKTGQAL